MLLLSVGLKAGARLCVWSLLLSDFVGFVLLLCIISGCGGFWLVPMFGVSASVFW